MKCLIVINSFSVNKATENKAQRLKEELQKRQVEVDIKGANDLPITFKDSMAHIDGIEGYDFCLYLDKDKYLDAVLAQTIPVFNNPIATAWCDDKALTYLQILGLGIKTPKTIPAPLCYVPNPPENEVIKFLDFVEKSLGYPLVCKEAYGSLGKQVYLIENRQQLDEKYRQLLNTTHLYQEFIGTDPQHGEDYRLITIGGHYVAGMKRINEHDFRSNIGAGGQAFKIANLPLSFQNAAEKISQKLGLDYAGIDLVMGPNNEPYFYEANSNAFFEEIEKNTGVNIAGLFVEHCLKKMSQNP